MIQEAYCSKEVSELLKKKGFLKGIDLRLISNLAFYTCTGLQYNIAKWYDSLIQDKIDFVVAPTHQMAMAWLREEHNIFIIIEPRSHIAKTSTYMFGMWIKSTYEQHFERFFSYEEAVEAALKYALEVLI